MKIRFLLLLCLCCFRLHAQPTLTRSNYFEIGDSALVYQKSDASLLGFNTGPTGANVVWDYSTLDFTHPSVSVDTLLYIDPVGTPYYPSTMSADYSQSNLCFKVLTDPFSPVNSDYNYCYANADSLSFIGHWAAGGGNEIWEDHCTDYIKQLVFPFTYQDTFVDPFQRFYFDMSGSDAHYITGTHSITADGYGTLLTPDGTTIPDVLRIHSVESVRDSNVFFGITYRTQHNYYWYFANHRGYILQLQMYGNDSTLISTAYYQKQTNLTSSVESIKHKSDFSIYPNPGNGRFHINYTGNENISLEIYDFKGQFINSIRPLSRGMNEVDLSFLSAGVYFFRSTMAKGVVGEWVVVE